MMSPSTGRGLSEREVWQAADALLAEGARPTIERVRARIGRGSPNTVSLHLEGWFAGLSARIADPAAFVAGGAGAWPAAVGEAFATTWAAVAKIADEAAEARLAQAQQQARDEVAAAEARAHAAADRAAAAIEDAAGISRTLAAVQAELVESRAESSGWQARASAAAARIAELDRMLADERTDRGRERETVAAAHASLVVERDAANARADAADRRVAHELDRERQARADAERRLRAAEQRVETQSRTMASVVEERDRWRSESASHAAVAEAARDAERRTADSVASLGARIEELQRELAQAWTDATAMDAAVAPRAVVAASAGARRAAVAPGVASSSGALRRVGGATPTLRRRPTRWT